MTKKREHPIEIAIGENPAMKAFDLRILVGNFRDKKSAQEYADSIVEFLEKNANAEFFSVQ